MVRFFAKIDKSDAHQLNIFIYTWGAILLKSQLDQGFFFHCRNNPFASLLRFPAVGSANGVMERLRFERTVQELLHNSCGRI